MSSTGTHPVVLLAFLVFATVVHCGKDPIDNLVQTFKECKKQSTGLQDYKKNVLDKIGNETCHATLKKHCQYQCILKKLEVIKQDGSLDVTKVEKIRKDNKLGGAEGEHAASVIKECSEGKKLNSEEKGCKEIKKLYECLKKKFIKACHEQKHDKKKSSSSSSSSESGEKKKKKHKDKH